MGPLAPYVGGIGGSSAPYVGGIGGSSCSLCCRSGVGASSLSLRTLETFSVQDRVPATDQHWQR